LPESLFTNSLKVSDLSHQVTDLQKVERFPASRDLPRIRVAKPRKVCAASMFLRRLLRPLNQLFVSAALALPRRKNLIGIAGTLVNRPLGWNDLATASRTSAPSRSPFFDVEGVDLTILFHVLNSNFPDSKWLRSLCGTRCPRSQPSLFAVTKSDKEDAAKN
jgi:hypothetical protein